MTCMAHSISISKLEISFVEEILCNGNDVCTDEIRTNILFPIVLFNIYAICS